MADAKGRNVRSIDGVNKDDELSLYVTDGVIRTKVTDLQKIDYQNT